MALNVNRNDYPITITVEGPRGIGKTTVVDFIEKALKARGIETVIDPRPIGTLETIVAESPIYAGR